MADTQTEYRAYIIGSDGHIASFHPYVCHDDDHAIAWAKHLAAAQAVELWSRARFVTRIQAKQEVA